VAESRRRALTFDMSSPRYVPHIIKSKQLVSGSDRCRLHGGPGATSDCSTLALRDCHHKRNKKVSYVFRLRRRSMSSVRTTLVRRSTSVFSSRRVPSSRVDPSRSSSASFVVRRFVVESFSIRSFDRSIVFFLAIVESSTLSLYTNPFL